MSTAGLCSFVVTSAICDREKYIETNVTMKLNLVCWQAVAEHQSLG